MATKLVAETDFAGGYTIGARESQQDMYAFSSPDDSARGELLIVVSDGMGGHRGGQMASQTAVSAFFEHWFNEPQNAPAERLHQALLAANHRIATVAADNPTELEGMGCTFVAAVFSPLEGLHWISVGDSSLFLFRDGKLTRLNEEHSMRSVLEKEVLAGKITEKEAANFPGRSQLLSALNGEEISMIDLPDLPTPLCPGDMVLAASDGLLTVDTATITKLMTAHGKGPAAELVRKLLDAVAAKRMPKQDNTTVAILRVPERERGDTVIIKHKPWATTASAV